MRVCFVTDRCDCLLIGTDDDPRVRIERNFRAAAEPRSDFFFSFSFYLPQSHSFPRGIRWIATLFFVR